MINAIIVDENKKSAEITSASLNKTAGVIALGCFCNFSEFKNDEKLVENCNLIIFDINSKNSSGIIAEVNEIKKKNNKINFIATSYEINNELVNKTLKEGVSDFLLKPILDGILEAAIKKINPQNNTKQSKAISIFSNKGAIGKTSLAVNLAYDLANAKENVCLLDLSANTEDISAFLDIEAKFEMKYLISHLENVNEEIIRSLLSQYRNSNLYVFSAKEDENYKLKPQDISKIIAILKKFFSYVIIDTASIINEETVTVLSNSDLILLICLANMASIRNTQKCLEVFSNIGYEEDKTKLILNRHIQNSEITIEDIERTLDKKIFHTVPNNYLTLIDAINLGHCVEEINPQSNIAKAYKKLADSISEIEFLNPGSKSKNYTFDKYSLLKRMGE